jgi:anti-sigma-K factor RskA
MGLVQQGEKIDRLTAELGQERQRVAELEQAGGETALVTSTAAVVMPLQPAGEPPLQPGARGVLLVADDHRHWYLSVQGLPPAAPGRDYQLWFIAGGKPISAGTFEVPAGAVPVALSAPEMPPGTEIAAITIEPDGGGAQPTGPMVLKTAEPLKIL